MATNLKLFLSSKPPPHDNYHHCTRTTNLSRHLLPFPVSNRTFCSLHSFRSSKNNSNDYSRSRRRSYRVCNKAADVQSKDVSDAAEVTVLAGRDRLLKILRLEVQVPTENIRNFSIIAHIDHGKSTLADKLLQVTGTVPSREMKEQFLDNMDLERERGITIKLQAARMRFMHEDRPYCLNLIDTPGHVDFSYEVSRSLAACEGALLVVDASQASLSIFYRVGPFSLNYLCYYGLPWFQDGVEAQTLANVYLALENNLEVIPVLNKIDLPGAEPNRVVQEIEEVSSQEAIVIGLDCSNAIYCSAKEGIGIKEILNAIVQRIPPPLNSAGRPLRALIFDSYYDAYRGVIVYFRVIDGTVKKGDRILFMASGKDYFADEIGVLSPNQLQVDELYAGEVGYISASIRSVADARVGDTITHYSRKAEQSLPGYKEATPMVFCGLFPIDADQYSYFLSYYLPQKLHCYGTFLPSSVISLIGIIRCNRFPDLRDALDKLQLNDAALKFEPETSSAMGFGFRCGFLGLLHMEIVQERLEREYNLSLITTAPSVVYRVNCTNGETVECSNPSLLPEPGKRRSVEEPIVKMVGDFFDQLKSRSKGYASMEYSFIGYKESDLIKLDVLINSEGVEPLSTIVHRDKAYSVGRALTQKLKELIPRQMFKVPIQACIGTKVIASESLSAIRKDVLAKCYGKCGDISRKKKLLKKQVIAAGKKRMKAIGKVDVPQEAFMAVLKLEKEVL
ncbi:Elongation factor 4 [Cynara cardunculus var. scolymus]|uniref:Translation factor GUF1 homolog, mitochondrial n=1 Tax=Cynara cardunculus var. scolymus TaxID=59895 RepID=A0A103Y0X8_CYNCS|nr:Elongation factor 4 [Cynara cardunculus var. scolymus]